ncbi:MAG: hypothetical protein AMXMBFR61_26730 [Fimbriimonadales bacterium]
MKTWMVRSALLPAVAALALMPGCGGGGGGGASGIALSGNVLMVGTGLPPNPPVTVTAGGNGAQTRLSDGGFSFQVPSGTASLTITGAGLPTFVYSFPAVTSSTNVGFLYVGPQQVQVIGRILDAETLEVVEGATVTMLGRRTATAADGTFSLSSVAYDPNGFLQIVYLVEKTGYTPREAPVEMPAVGGVIDLGDTLLAPESSTEPPPGPSNIFGFVTEPGGNGSAVLVKLVRRSDNAVVAAFVTGSLLGSPANRYQFWVAVGEYRLEFEKPFGTLRITRDVDLVDVDEPVRVDVTLP